MSERITLIRIITIIKNTSSLTSSSFFAFPVTKTTDLPAGTAMLTRSSSRNLSSVIFRKIYRGGPNFPPNENTSGNVVANETRALNASTNHRAALKRLTRKVVQSESSTARNMVRVNNSIRGTMRIGDSPGERHY